MDKAPPSMRAPRGPAPVARKTAAGNQASIRNLEPVDSPLEREADRVAADVMRMPPAAPPIQRKCAECEDEERVARKSSSNAPLPDTSPAMAVGGGRPLDRTTRAFFEPRFGRDFSAVRVHTGSDAAASASSLHALAYTKGTDIVFNAGHFAPQTHEGRQLIAHELAHVVQQSGPRALGIQRKCQSDIGTPEPDCKPSQDSLNGWQFKFKMGCDDLQPGEDAKIEKLAADSTLEIHGFASKEGDASFNESLSCARANVIAALVRAKRPGCKIDDVFKHGASPAPGALPDVNPPDFWRSVVIKETKAKTAEQWLDQWSIIRGAKDSLVKVQADPSSSNLEAMAKWRPGLRNWLDNVAKALAPANAKLTAVNLDDYRRFYANAEDTWRQIDQALALNKRLEATQDTWADWAKDTSKQNQTDDLHIKTAVPAAKYHVDLFGEGHFKGAINLGMADRTSTTGVSGARVPNLIYRKFTNKDDTKIPIADHVADLITEENGPIGKEGLAEEIARVIAPGGTIILYNPDGSEADHDKVAKAVGGTVTKSKFDGTIQTTIVAPAKQTP